MSTEQFMYESKLEVRRGNDGKPDLRFDLKINEAEEALFPNKKFPAGLVFSRDTDGLSVKLGCVGNKVPFFLGDQSDRPMSSMMGAPATSADKTMGGYLGAGSRIMRFFHGMGNFECSTTEFKTGVAYTVDMPLKAVGFATPATYDALAGRLQPSDYDSTDTIVGIVSRPYTDGTPTYNVHKGKALYFMTCFIPDRRA